MKEQKLFVNRYWWVTKNTPRKMKKRIFGTKDRPTKKFLQLSQIMENQRVQLNKFLEEEIVGLTKEFSLATLTTNESLEKLAKIVGFPTKHEYNEFAKDAAPFLGIPAVYLQIGEKLED